MLWVITVGMAGAIFFFSEQSAEQSSALSGGVARGLFSFWHLTEQQQAALHELVRSAAHVATFAALGLFSSLLAHSYAPRWGLPAAVGGGCGYAMLDECHQLWRAAGRAFEWADIAKDSAGVLLGAAVAALVLWGLKKATRERTSKHGIPSGGVG